MNNDTNSEYHMNEAHWIDICGALLHFGQYFCFQLKVETAVLSIFPNNPLDCIGRSDPATAADADSPAAYLVKVDPWHLPPASALIQT